MKLGHRDGWECWLWGGAVDPDEPTGSLWARHDTAWWTVRVRRVS